MNDRLYVKPADAGAVVLDPKDGKPLPPEGAAVPDNAYWRRRLADGSVVETMPAAIVAGAIRRKGEQERAAQEAAVASGATKSTAEDVKPAGKEKGK